MSRFYIENGEILDCGFFLGSKEQYVDIMNKQDQRIAELEQDLEFTTKTANELIEIKHKLEQQLAEKDKEINELNKKITQMEEQDVTFYNQLAIQELEKFRAKLVNRFSPVELGYTEYVQKVLEIINQQIKELKGE